MVASFPAPHSALDCTASKSYITNLVGLLVNYIVQFISTLVEKFLTGLVGIR